MPYSLDASGLLDGWVRYYSPDVFPSLWKQMEKAAADIEPSTHPTDSSAYLLLTP